MTEYEIKPKKVFSFNIKELIEYKELFFFFTWRDIKVKYKQTLLGFLWAVLQPLLMMLIFSLFLGEKIKDPNSDIPYPIFVLSGLVLWTVFSSGLTSAGNSMVTNANIIKKIYFPRLIIPISAILVSLFDFVMASLIFIILLVYFQVKIDISLKLLFVPIGIILTCLATLGMGTLLAALNIKYRDFRYVIPFMLQAMMFLSPVIYPMNNLSNVWIKYVIGLNPMYAPIELFRTGIMGGTINTELILISIFSCLLFFIIGLYYFRKTEAYFADIA